MIDIEKFEQDWGENGKQWTGGMVQKFIKDNFLAIIQGLNALEGSVNKNEDSLKAAESQLQNTLSNLNTVNAQLTAVSGQFSMLQNQLSNLMASSSYKAAVDECRIVYFYNTNSSSVRLCTPFEWGSISNSSATPIGIAIMRSDQMPLVMSLKETRLPWAAKEALANEAHPSYSEALEQTGKESSSKIIEKGATLFDGEQDSWKNKYAAPWCNAYAPSGSDISKSYQAGNWWLPSLSELMLICQHINAVRYCLSIIENADQMSVSFYASCVESATETVVGVSLQEGVINLGLEKNGTSYAVRAVTNFAG